MNYYLLFGPIVGYVIIVVYALIFFEGIDRTMSMVISGICLGCCWVLFNIASLSTYSIITTDYSYMKTPNSVVISLDNNDFISQSLSVYNYLEKPNQPLKVVYTQSLSGFIKTDEIRSFEVP